MARTTTTKKARSTSGKSRKNTKKESAFKRFTRDHGMAIIFIVAFAVIGTIATFWTRAATSSATGTITGLAGKCLDNLDGKAVNGNKISLWTCDGTNSQQWTLPGDGTVRNAGYCLDVKGASKTKSTVVQLYKCNGTVAQQWKVNASAKTVVNPNSNMCLDVRSSHSADGTQIQIYTCNGTNAQKWTVPTASTGGGTGGGSGGGSTGGASGEAMPGAVAGWKQVFADDFTTNVPLGAFSDCNHNVDTPQAYCGGLKNYGSYYTNWWAYPNNWDDTAATGADGNGGAPFGGTYHPEDVVSVSGGQMHINMFRPTSGGNNHVATVVPRKCMQQLYGRYIERFKVAKAVTGFKSAHLFYDNGHEMDYPESDDYTQTINAFTHPSEENFNTSAKWTDWHTTTIEWTPGSVKYYMDGKLIGTAKKNIPNFKMTWALQNESSIAGPYAKAGASAQLDLDWVTCYSQS
ncbi:MAG TPA: RICIN domain-containing protein [Candidatus Saccharimonadales bacterium]|nr:RICIN domain-containing protein [Candidatus Saccharimonadales bacterium]